MKYKTLHTILILAIDLLFEPGFREGVSWQWVKSEFYFQGVNIEFKDECMKKINLSTLHTPSLFGLCSEMPAKSFVLNHIIN